MNSLFSMVYNSLLPLFILVLRLPKFSQWEPFKLTLGSLQSSIIFSSVSLLFSITKGCTLILTVSCPSPEVSHFSKEPWSLLVGECYYRPKPGYQKYTHTPMYIYIFAHNIRTHILNICAICMHIHIQIHILEITSLYQYLQFQSIPTGSFLPSPISYLYVPTSTMRSLVPATSTRILVCSITHLKQFQNGVAYPTANTNNSEDLFTVLLLPFAVIVYI